MSISIYEQASFVQILGVKVASYMVPQVL
jgi:hypothetical protein